MGDGKIGRWDIGKHPTQNHIDYCFEKEENSILKKKSYPFEITKYIIFIITNTNNLN